MTLCRRPQPGACHCKTQNNRRAKHPHRQQAPAPCPLGKPSHTAIAGRYIANQNGLRVRFCNGLNFSTGIDDRRPPELVARMVGRFSSMLRMRAICKCCGITTVLPNQAILLMLTKSEGVLSCSTANLCASSSPNKSS